MTLVNAQYLDYSGEKSSVAFNVVTPSGAAFDWAAWDLMIDGIVDTIDDVSLCRGGPTSARTQLSTGSQELPADEEAQRESGLRIFYYDTTTQAKYHLTIPGPEHALMAVQGQDQVDLTGTEMAALVTAFEANVKSPTGGAIEISKGVLVGRRN